MATPSQSQTIAIKREEKTVEIFTHNLNSSNRCQTTNEHLSNYANKQWSQRDSIFHNISLVLSDKSEMDICSHPVKSPFHTFKVGHKNFRTNKKQCNPLTFPKIGNRAMIQTGYKFHAHILKNAVKFKIRPPKFFFH